MTHDITHCLGYNEREEECPIRQRCRRWGQRLDLPDMIAHWTMYAPGRYVYDVQGEPPDWECEHFMPEEDT